MQAQYDWIKEQIAQGKTVLAYDRRQPRARVYRIKCDDCIALVCGMLFVCGAPAFGWTFALKPEGK